MPGAPIDRVLRELRATTAEVVAIGRRRTESRPTLEGADAEDAGRARPFYARGSSFTPTGVVTREVAITEEEYEAFRQAGAAVES